MTNAERLTAIEVEFRLHREQTEKDMKELKTQNETMQKSIESLLSLKSKGQGAFWLATTLFGTSFALFITYVVSWFK